MGILAPQPVQDRKQDDNNRSFYREFERIQHNKIDITTVVGADTEFSVTHKLSRIPSYVVVVPRDGQTDAYIQVKPSGTAWTNSLLYLKCNTATATFSILVW